MTFTPKSDAALARPSPIAQISTGLLLAAVATLTILVCAPFNSSFPSATLDASWMYAVNVAIARGLQFGKDVVFTFGPLAGVYTRQYSPATDTLMLISGIALAASLFAGFAILSRRNRLWLLALPVLMIQGETSDILVIGLPLVVLFATSRLEGANWHGRLAPVVGMAALGVLPLIKGSAIPTVIFCGLSTVYIVWRRSKPLALAAVGCFLTAMIAGWASAGQKLSNLPHYFVAQSPIISGYTNAMSLSGSWVHLATYSSAAIVILGALWTFKTPYRWLLMCASALFLFLCFKAGFVRHDGHSVIAAHAILFIGYMCFLFVRDLKSVALMAIALLSWYLILPEGREPTPASIARNFSNDLSAASSAAVDRFTGSPDLKRRFDEANEAIRKSHPLPATLGSADLYPTDLAVLIANQIDWRPRPVIQSYSAYTSSLVAQNAAHLSANGPDRIFFSVGSIDERYPSMDDGPSWLSLLSTYEPTAYAGNYLVLDRSRSATQLRLGEPLAMVTVPTGQSLDIPKAEAPLYVQVDLEPTFLGKLTSIIFKPPKLHLVVEYPDGRQQTYRFIDGVGHQGFLISPTIASPTEFAALRTRLWNAYLQDKMPVRMGIYGASGTRFTWKASYKVRFHALAVPASKKAEALVFPPPLRLAAISSLPVVSDCFIDSINGKEKNAGQMRLSSPLLQVRGWGAISAKNGVASDEIFVGIISQNGSALLFPQSKKMERPDLWKTYDRKELLMSGFVSVVDTTLDPLPADLRLILKQGDKLYACDKHLKLE